MAMPPPQDHLTSAIHLRLSMILAKVTGNGPRSPGVPFFLDKYLYNNCNTIHVTLGQIYRGVHHLRNNLAQVEGELATMRQVFPFIILMK